MYTVGIDEAGRGSLAGPVVVAAVAIPYGFYPKDKTLPPLRDSKQLSPKQRDEWFLYIKSEPNIFFSSGRVYQSRIDAQNIAWAANLAASRALDGVMVNLKQKKFRVILDGSLFLGSKDHAHLKPRTIIRGDEKFVSIKLASIVAKETRDAYMRRLHKKFPEYEFEEHKGYGTKLHKARIKKYGPSHFHRLTYL